MRYLFFLLFVFFGAEINPILAQVSIGTKRESGDRMNSPVGVDLSLLVKSLRNSNEKPQIIGGNEVRFSSNYNFEEQRRIWKVIKTLMVYSEEAWPELVKNLDNKEYSCTLGFGSGPKNYSVANVCEQLIRNALRAGYYAHVGLLQGADVGNVDLIDPESRGIERLRNWVQARQGKASG